MAVSSRDMRLPALQVFTYGLVADDAVYRAFTGNSQQT